MNKDKSTKTKELYNINKLESEFQNNNIKIVA